MSALEREHEALDVPESELTLERLVPLIVPSSLASKEWPGPLMRLRVPGIAVAWGFNFPGSTVRYLTSDLAAAWDQAGIDWRRQALKNLAATSRAILIGQAMRSGERTIALLLDQADGLGPSRLLLNSVWEQEFPKGYLCALPTRTVALVAPIDLTAEERAKLEHFVAESHTAGSEAMLREWFSPASLRAAPDRAPRIREQPAPQPRWRTLPKRRGKTRIVIGCLLMLLGSGLLFRSWDWVKSVWHGPRLMALEELSSITELPDVPNRWVAFAFDEAFDGRLKENLGNETQRRFILIRVKDNWLLAAVPESFKGSYVEGYLEKWKGLDWDEIQGRLSRPAGATLLPYQLDAAYPQQSRLNALLGVVAALVLAGLCLALWP